MDATRNNAEGTFDRHWVAGFSSWVLLLAGGIAIGLFEPWSALLMWGPLVVLSSLPNARARRIFAGTVLPPLVIADVYIVFFSLSEGTVYIASLLNFAWVTKGRIQQFIGGALLPLVVIGCAAAGAWEPQIAAVFILFLIAFWWFWEYRERREFQIPFLLLLIAIIVVGIVWDLQHPPMRR